MFLHKGKRRRAQADFPGAEIILRQIKEKAKRKRVGLVSKGPPARGKEGLSWRVASTILKRSIFSPHESFALFYRS